MQAAIQAIQPFLRDLPLWLPRTIQVIKTTGAEEGNAAELTKSQKDLTGIPGALQSKGKD